MSDNGRAQEYMDQLAAELRDRGLNVAARLPALTATNPGVASQDPRDDAMIPSLRQSVLIRDYEGLGLFWCWVWEALRSAERGVPTPPPEVQPMCKASNIMQAADNIANVVRLRDNELVRSAGNV